MIDMRNLLFIIVLLIFAGCSPYKKLDRLLKKYPELVNTISDTTYKDSTLYIIDSVTVSGSRMEEKFKIKQLDRKQTFLVENGQAITLVTYKPVSPQSPPEIEVRTKVKERKIHITDTVKIKIPEYRNREVIVTRPIYFIKWYDWIVRLVALIAFVIGIKQGWAYLQSISKR